MDVAGIRQGASQDGGGGGRGGRDGRGGRLDWRGEIPSLLVILVAAAATLLAWPHLSGEVATHYGANGRANAWAPAHAAAIRQLGLLAGVYLLTVLLPRIDPRQENNRRFGGALRSVRFLLTLFVGGLTGLTLAQGLGYRAETSRLVPVGVSLLLIFLGNLMPRIRSNWFFGVRTPWALSSDDVWRRTQRVGGMGLVLAGIVGLPLAWLGLDAPWLAELLLLGLAVPTVYSYLVWRREVRP